MSALNNAANDLKRLIPKFRGILSLADELEKLGNVEDAIASGKSRIDATRKQEEDAAKRLKEANAAVKDAEAKAAGLLETAKTEAGTIVSDAKAEAAKIKKAATEKAQGAIDAANQKASQALDAVKEANGVLESVNAELSTATQKRDSMNAEIAKLREKLG